MALNSNIIAFQNRFVDNFLSHWEAHKTMLNFTGGYNANLMHDTLPVYFPMNIHGTLAH